MNDTSNDIELPVFPTPAAPALADPVAAKTLFEPVLGHLATIVDIPDRELDRSTPCQDYTVAELRRHVLAWLQFFAAALDDPDDETGRFDPDTWQLDPGVAPSSIVERAVTDIGRAVDGGVAERLVTMSQARMAGDGVLAMAIGEYLVHGWDLAVATGRAWPPATDGPGNTAAAEVALAFLQGTVAPEYRGPDSGFFDQEVEPPEGADAFVRLLCFAGRQPDWTPPAA